MRRPHLASIVEYERATVGFPCKKIAKRGLRLDSQTEILGVLRAYNLSRTLPECMEGSLS